MKASKATLLDLTTLPEQARQEVTDFYQFLARKYRPKKPRAVHDSGMKQFFRQYQLDLGSYHFNREEAHER